MKLTVVTNQETTIKYFNVVDIKYSRGLGRMKEISFYTKDKVGKIEQHWEYLNDIRSIVLSEY